MIGVRSYTTDDTKARKGGRGLGIDEFLTIDGTVVKLDPMSFAVESKM